MPLRRSPLPCCFFSAVFAVHATEPGVVSLGDAVWLCFQVVTTIGLGDFTSTTMAGRLAIMLLSAYSVFFLAIVTGAVVSYCSEVMRRDWDEDVSELLDELDRLPELSRGELVEFSARAKRVLSRLRR